MAGRGTDEGRRKLPGSGRAQPLPSAPGSYGPGNRKAAMERRMARTLSQRVPAPQGVETQRMRRSALRPLAFGEGQEEGPAKRGRTTAYPAPPRIRGMTLALARYLSKPGTRLRWLREIFVDDIPINRRQRAQVGDRHALVHLMHGLPDQAEFHHRAMGEDEARIGGAAAGGQFRRAAGDFLDRLGHQFGERARLGDEYPGVRWLPLERVVDLAAGRFDGALLDQLFQRIQRVLVVEADIETRACLAGNEIDRLVADVDRSEFQMRWREQRGTAIERLGLQRRNERHQPADRIFRPLRIGDMALPAGHDQVAVERTAAADLDGVAQFRDIARLAQNAVVEFFAALSRPLQKLGRAVDRDAFLVAGDQERDRAFWLAGKMAEMFGPGAEWAGVPALHVTAPRP